MRTGLILTAAGAALILSAGGCSKRKLSDYTPQPDNARSALETALNSWKNGGPEGKIAGTSNPTLEAHDSDWKAGQKLQSFEILREEAEHEGSERVFTVRLTTNKKPATEVKYMVIGRDPLNIYRDVDWEKLKGMSK